MAVALEVRRVLTQCRAFAEPFKFGAVILLTSLCGKFILTTLMTELTFLSQPHCCPQ